MRTDQSKKISVIVPAYNASRWIRETLESVRIQQSVAVEIIVIDDGSTDDTASIVESEFPDFKLIRQSNQGVSSARNHGTSLATGTYVKYLDSDDLLLPGVLERQLELALSTCADVVYGNWQKLTQSKTGEWTRDEKVERCIEDISTDHELAFFTKMWCTTGAYLWSRQFLEERHPGWHAGLPIIQDARFALDAAMCHARFVHDPHLASLYRCQPNSLSAKSRLAFNRDCLNNAKEVLGIWQQRNAVTPARRYAALELCENFGLWSYEFDKSLAREFFEFARSIDPNWHLTQTPTRRIVSKTCGVECFAAVRSLFASWR